VATEPAVRRHIVLWPGTSTGIWANLWEDGLKALVTGGSGFIGSHLCARLLERGLKVVCVDNLLTGSEANIAALKSHPDFQFLVQDVSYPFEFAADLIFHLASPASPIGYWRLPFETIRVNSQGTMLLLEQARRLGARFVMVSTSEAYGDPEIHPQPETYWGNVNPVGPRACYDESKRLGETITMEYFRQYKTDARIVRVFNTYGPHSQPGDGRMIPNFVTQALSGQPITVHGDGSQTRSLCYVDDLVEGLLAVGFADGIGGEVFNLGNPEERTVREWAELVIELANSSSPICFESRRIEDPERRRPDISKAQKLINWTPTVSAESGLSRTIAWFREALESASCLSPTIP